MSFPGTTIPFLFARGPPAEACVQCACCAFLPVRKENNEDARGERLSSRLSSSFSVRKRTTVPAASQRKLGPGLFLTHRQDLNVSLIERHAGRVVAVSSGSAARVTIVT